MEQARVIFLATTTVVEQQQLQSGSLETRQLHKGCVVFYA